MRIAAPPERRAACEEGTFQGRAAGTEKFAVIEQGREEGRWQWEARPIRRCTEWCGEGVWEPVGAWRDPGSWLRLRTVGTDMTDCILCSEVRTSHSGLATGWVGQVGLKPAVI